MLNHSEYVVSKQNKKQCAQKRYPVEPLDFIWHIESDCKDMIQITKLMKY